MRRPGPRRERLLQRGGTGGFAFATRLHREVKPESGLTLYEIFDMKACRITTLFWGRGKRRRKGSVGFSGFSGGRGREWSEGKKGGRGCPLCCFDHKAQPRRDMYPACGAAGLIKLLLTRVSPVFSRSVSSSYRAVRSRHQAPTACAPAVVSLLF